MSPFARSSALERLRRLLFSRHGRRLWAALFVFFTSYTLASALSPFPRGPALGWDKANHVLAFAALAFAGLLALRERPRPLLTLSLGLLALGVGIEVGQAFVPGRSPDGLDVLADAMGIVLGLGMASGLAQSMDRRAHRRGARSTATAPHALSEVKGRPAPR